MQLQDLSFSPYSHLFLTVGHRVQLNELLLLLIVVSCRHDPTHEDRRQYGETFNPGDVPVLGSREGHFQPDRHKGSHYEDLEDKVIKGLKEKLPKAWWLLRLLLIVPESGSSCF